MAIILEFTMGFAYKNGYIDYIVHNRYKKSQELINFNNQEEFIEKINLDNNFIDENKINKEKLMHYFQEINQTSWFKQNSNEWRDFDFIDQNDENQNTFNFNIKRNYNLQEKYIINGKIIFNVTQEENKIKNISIVIPNLEWYNSIMNWKPEQLQFSFNFN
ncbi:hypothetical protein [Spiroplasma taiwanense]|uniref:Uncharacterized protein n=1 Tax=Spiroplasma taiwanense CT-1 TaxID=1276220 RepID=S5MGS5_9MOLU|nr:hypothetical protein [Spiroplasma taiwanense]AGR41050.1 hypothetical protein STAIW_v1c04000 [Spiroplasma taiwanense CT-1]